MTSIQQKSAAISSALKKLVSGFRTPDRRSGWKPDTSLHACEQAEQRLLMTADFVAIRVDGPETVSPGDRIAVQYGMENRGTSNPRFWKYSHTIEDLNGNVVSVLGTSTVPDLRPGTSIGTTGQQRFTIPSDIQPGTYRYVFTVDSTNSVRELSESNNRATDTFTVRGATGGGGTCIYRDSNDTVSEAADLGTITDAATQSGYAIDAGCDVDMFSFTVRANQRVGIDLDVPVGLNSHLRLFNSAGEELDSDGFGTAPDEAFDLGRAGREAYIEHTFREAGTYYVGVSADGNESYDAVSGSGDRTGNSSGSFSLTVSHVRDVAPSVENGSLSGVLFHDLNGDGEWNQGTEDTLNGWRIYLDSNQNGIGDFGETYVTTDSQGRYRFDSLPPGAHRFVVSRTGYNQTTTPVLKTQADYRLLAVRDRVGGETDLITLGENGWATQLHQPTWTDNVDFDPITGNLVFATSLLREQDLETGQRSTAGQILDADGERVFIEDFAFSPDGLLYGVVFDTTSVLYNLKPDGNDWRAERVATLGREFDGTVQGSIEFDGSGTFYVTSGKFGSSSGQITIKASLCEVSPITGVTIRTIGDLSSFVYDLEATPDGRLLALTTSTSESSTIRELSTEDADVLFEQEFPFWIRDFTAEVTDYDVPEDGGGWAMVLRNGEDVTEWNVGFEKTEVTPPARAEVTGPTDTDSRRPELTWNAVDGAEYYELWVNNRTTGQRVIHRTEVTATSFTPDADLQDGSHRVWVRAGNSAGWGPWSRNADFHLATVSKPGRAVVTGPSGAASTRPAYTWAATAGADSYELWVTEISSGKQVFHKRGIEGTSFASPATLNKGAHRVWVRAWNAAGAGSWSAAMNFTVGGQVPPQGRGSVLGPSHTSSRNPLFTWAALENADRYELWVTHVETGRVVLHDRNLTSTSTTFSDALPTGKFRVWVRGGNAAGWGVWSSAHVFSIS